MNIVFFGTSDYCLPIAEALQKNFELSLIITRPDKPVGRKGTLTPSATKIWAEKNGIKVATPETLKKDTPSRLELEHELEQSKPDLAVVSDYGLIIPEKIFSLPKYGTINVHFSKLPDLRGPSPVQFALLRGDDEIWVSVFKLQNPPDLEIKMDSGPIIFQQPYSILPNDTTKAVYRRTFQMAAQIVINAINTIDNLPLKDQDHSKATFCRFLTKDDGFIEWDVLEKASRGEKVAVNELPKIQQEALMTKKVPIIHNSSSTIHNFFRAATPWPGMFTLSPSKGGHKRMIIRKCHLAGEKLVLDEIQFEGKNPTSFKSR